MTPKAIDSIINTAKPLNGIVWNVMGQVYIPKKLDEKYLWWEAIMPEETFVPPHSHSTQDEFLYLVEGELDMLFDGEERHAKAGEILHFPRGVTHGLFNNYGHTARGVFWVHPTNMLFDLFKAIHNVADPKEVVRIADKHEIHFQLPGQAPRQTALAD